MKDKKNNQLFLIKWFKQFMVLLMILIAPGTGLSKTLTCKDAGRHLQGGFETIQAKGGLWAYFERSSALKDKSMLGFQLDSKLQRAVVMFQEQCLNKATPPPSPELYKKITEFIDTARTINNKSVARTHPSKIISAIQGLLKDLDSLLKN